MPALLALSILISGCGAKATSGDETACQLIATNANKETAIEWELNQSIQEQGGLGTPKSSRTKELFTRWFKSHDDLSDSVTSASERAETAELERAIDQYELAFVELSADSSPDALVAGAAAIEALNEVISTCQSLGVDVSLDESPGMDDVY